ncbi:response regulator transcription factor [bacterium]|nr:response regulator transcription factor [bacterium]
MRILLIEDDIQIASFIMKGLKEAGYYTTHACNGRDGLALVCQEPFDAAIIDIMLPQMNGIEVIQQMRASDINTPTLILSAKNSVNDRVRGLEAGSDDYLVKPFAFTELLARTQALIRRSQSLRQPDHLTIGDLVIDTVKRKVSREDVFIDLQPRELALLEYMMRNKGRIVSKTMIMENVWDYNFDPQTNVVEARMCKLRDKVDKPFDKKYLHTIRGAGYRCDDES